MRRFILLLVVIILGLASAAQAEPLNEATEINRATVVADRWCRTHFRNPFLTSFVGCQFSIADPRGRSANGRRVPMWQAVQGSTIASPCGGPEPCLNSIGWFARRRYDVRIDDSGRRRISRSPWRCYPHGTNAPLNWPGLRCFAHDPRNPF